MNFVVYEGASGGHGMMDAAQYERLCEQLDARRAAAGEEPLDRAPLVETFQAATRSEALQVFRRKYLGDAVVSHEIRDLNRRVHALGKELGLCIAERIACACASAHGASVAASAVQIALAEAQRVIREQAASNRFVDAHACQQAHEALRQIVGAALDVMPETPLAPWDPEEYRERAEPR